MGICYQIKMQDDFNWGYVGLTKKERLEKFSDEFNKLRGYKPSLIAEWYGHAIFDLNKTAPSYGEVLNLILNSCDSAIYWDDYKPYEVKELAKEK